jgi:hypothetical protein
VHLIRSVFVFVCFVCFSVTNINEEANPFWRTFKGTLEGSCGKTKVVPQIFPAGTDSRFLRRALIPVIGFSPLNLTPVLLHDHDEFIGVETFLRGVKVYEKLIPALANLTEVTRNEQGVYKEQKQVLDVLPEGVKGAWSGSRAFPEGAASVPASAFASAAAAAAAVSASAAPAAAGVGSQTDTPVPAQVASPIPTQTEAAPAVEPRATQTDVAAAGAGAQQQTAAGTQTEQSSQA